MTARIIPMIIVSWTSAMLLRIHFAVSYTNTRRGFPLCVLITSFTRSIRFTTLSATATELAPDCL